MVFFSTLEELGLVRQVEKDIKSCTFIFLEINAPIHRIFNEKFGIIKTKPDPPDASLVVKNGSKICR